MVFILTVKNVKITITKNITECTKLKLLNIIKNMLKLIRANKLKAKPIKNTGKLLQAIFVIVFIL